MGLGVHLPDGPLLLGHLRVQFVPPARERVQVLLQFRLGRGQDGVLLRQGVPDAGDVLKLRGEPVHGFEGAIPFRAQGGQPFPLSFDSFASFADRVAQLLPDLGQGRGEAVDLPSGVRELLLPSFERPLGPGRFVGKLFDPLPESGDLLVPPPEVLGEVGVFRYCPVPLAGQLLVFLDGDA